MNIGINFTIVLFQFCYYLHLLHRFKFQLRYAFCNLDKLLRLVTLGPGFMTKTNLKIVTLFVNKFIRSEFAFYSSETCPNSGRFLKKDS